MYKNADKRRLSGWVPGARGTLFLALGASVLFSLGLVAFSTWYTSKSYYLFLVWNLFLAFIPLLISSFIAQRRTTLPLAVLGLLTVVWLLFFPNAPYILTDLFHLRERGNIPLWFDLIVLLSFAWNGLMMGFVSLWDMQTVLTERLGRWSATAFVVLSLGLGSFGVYIGRYLRFNSWDVLADPFSLSYHIGQRFLNPWAFKGAWAMTLTFTIFLTLAYLTLTQLARLTHRPD